MDPSNDRAATEAHDALREMTRSLMFLLGGSPCACGATRCARCLGRGMEFLTHRLESHFVVEEESWRGIDRPRCDWTTLHWIDRLVDQHAEFRKRLGNLRAPLERARQAGEPLDAELSAELRVLLDELVEHELSEARLFQRSVFEGGSRID
ncbi:MAG: hypothetical protein ACKVXR_18520 [Planctomycetota bacterium]